MISIAILHSALLLACIAAGIVAARTTGRSWARGFFIALGAMAILALPAGIWQAVFGWPGISLGGGPVLERLIIPFIGWPFNAGGWTIQYLFETTVEPLEWLVGHRSATVLSNMSYYWFLLAVQSAVFAAIAACCCRKNTRPCHIVLVLLLIIYLANSIINVRWFWAGT
ncbi:MAG: hypothetical protein JXB18_14185 [Sedimentisphaerales bacterium]|nr:hypothetical protein [Sedimentisphaerales bacterium]